MHIPVDEISKRLADRVESVCQMLLPGGRPCKGEWLAGDLSGGAGDSLKVTMKGEHAGSWRDWAAGDECRGDLLDLWRMVHSLTPGEAIKQAKEYLGIVDPVKSSGTKTWSAPPANASAPIDAKGRAMNYLVHQRMLDPKIVNLFRIQGRSDENAIVFPCFNPADELVNRSYRTLPRTNEKKKVWQDAGCAPCLFGWHALSQDAYTERKVLLCEGQIDAMTWRQWGFNALSIPNGTGTTWIEYEWDNLAAFDDIYIAFDTDGAGKDNAAKVIQRLGTHRCLSVTIPHKDANEALQKGCDSQDAEAWIAKAKPPVIKDVVTAHQLKGRVAALNQKRAEAFTLPFFKIEWPDEGLYFRDGEVTLWVGDSFDGKSTFLKFLTLAAVFTKRSVFTASMEVMAEKTMDGLAKGVALSGETDLDQDKCFEMIAPYLYFADRVGYISRAELMEMMWFAFQRYGVTIFIVDSLMRIKDLEEDYPAQGEFMNDLQGFAKKTGSHVHMVAHTRKVAAGAKTSGSDIKGSSSLKGNTDNLCLLERNPEKKTLLMDGCTDRAKLDAMHDTKITVDKQRESGWVGKFLLKYHHRSGTFSKFDNLSPVEMLRRPVRA